ncbi:hypothetical protein M2459_000353 [Parabacteroides sp. PF5-5]|uniref:hypothetical protein n=1 Tax=unclassified Parabacteroides TaxID=2649774 RepID=UPI0024731C7C|nr:MULTISPECIES: hypothetical protein [unclassified Parabacteroides]MDH6306366.1 hypothetical protein [Parabacteroides sp. PH5-39]MDH6314638.1 hypothetical protein [Parabacteroides sp. PF5-13]MDH6321077.1 hypothetical protein [Parabacteroides sp. PH5-13]MDH6324809.1 hypothetical protein [Parabacteroides sp. PH5-8]MDH6325510.1 hypothetical protein [Parabacteroides sp. PH5-41]
MTKRGPLYLFLCGLVLMFHFSFLQGCTEDDDPQIIPPPEEDAYYGIHSQLMFTDETDKFHSLELACYFQTESGEIIKREATHLRMRDTSHFEMKAGLKEGLYRLLYLQYSYQTEGDTITESYGMGNLLEVNPQGFVKRSTYSQNVGFVGTGTKDDPYIISSDDHLYRLQKLVNDLDGNRDQLSPTAYYQQVADINLYFVSFKGDNANGWIPIGHEPGLPFQGYYDGGGYKIEDLWSHRGSTFGVGLFGYVNNAVISNVHIDRAEVLGLFATSALVGAAVTAGNSRDATIIRKCQVTGSTIDGEEGGFGTAGIIGAVDSRVKLLVDSCEVSGGTSIKGSFNVGGILGLGQIYSFCQITNCRNSSKIVEGSQSCVGGLIGSADTLIVQSCINETPVIGSTANSKDTRMGTGGIAGASGIALISACSNSETIEGKIGVGGILGSTRLRTDPHPIYNSVVLQSSINSGAISGEESVGGICGESQANCYALLNEGMITGKKFVGGIMGALPGGVVLNASNVGSLDATSHCGGIVGKADMAILALTQNFSPIQAKGKHVGGILGLGGNSTMIHYSGNFGDVANNADGNTGGIVGMIGDVNDWTATEIADLVIGSIYIVSGVGDWVTLGFDKILKAVKIGKSIADAALVASSMTNSVVSLFVNANNKELESWFASMEQDASQSNLQYTKIVQDKTDNLLKGMKLSSINSQLNSNGITDSYRRSYNDVIKYISNTDKEYANSERFIDKMNTKRNDRAKEVELKEKNKEMVFSVIGGVCSAVAGIAFVASLVVTAGGSAAALATFAAGAASIIGGVNTVVSTATDYTENSAIITQCVNAGKITGMSDRVCGIVGELEQNCQINDCINLGNGDGKKGYAFAYMRSDAVIENCLNGGLDWKDDLHMTNSITERGCYTLLSNSECYTLSLERLAQPSFYTGWSIGNGSKWRIPSSSKGYYPIPNLSEMQ